MQGEILIYKNTEGSIKIDVRLEDKSVWLTQAQMAGLFGKGRATIKEHIQKVFNERELDENSVCRNFRHAATDGKNYDAKYYNLDLIISVGYRVKSSQGKQFRIWATQRLKEYEFYELLCRNARAYSPNTNFATIFLSKNKDIYTTSIDCDPKDEKTIEFFKVVQNKLPWAISKQTAPSWYIAEWMLRCR